VLAPNGRSSAGSFARDRIIEIRRLRLSLLLFSCLFIDPPAALAAAKSFQEKWQSASPVSINGVLSVLYIDDFEHKRGEIVHDLKEAQSGKSFRLLFEKKARTDLRSGMAISVKARKNGPELLLLGDGSTEISFQSGAHTLTASANSISGDQKTLVIVANFTDKVVNPLMPGADCSIPAISDRMFTDPANYSVDDLYQDASRGQISFSGVVKGPYTIPYASNVACDLDGWTQAANALAAADGVNLAAYPRKVYVLPSNPVCGGSGIGDLDVTPSHAWIFTCDMHRVYAHELGHNLGLHHSSTAEDEYGDDSDPMGSQGLLKPLNAPHKWKLGWTPDSKVVTVAQNITVDIAPLSVDPAATSLAQTLKINKPDTGEAYYVSYRQATTGFEKNLYSIYMGRLSIHHWLGGLERTYLSAALQDGESFTDPVNGITVKLLSHDSAHATAQISFSGPPPPLSACDLNTDSFTNVTDIQICVNQAIGFSPCSTGDIKKDGICNVVDVQRIVNAVLGGACVSP